MADNVLAYLPANAAQLQSSEGTRRTSITVSGGDRPAITFDAAADEFVTWTVPYLPDLYSGSGTLKLAIQGVMASATSGNVIFSAAVEAVTRSDSTDLDATTSFDTASTSSGIGVPGTAGHLFGTDLTIANKDSAAVGDYLRVKLTRLGSNGSDTASGNFLLLGCTLIETVTHYDINGYTTGTGVLLPQVVQGRLTLESNTAVSTSDQTSKTSVFFTPFRGNQVTVYDGSTWRLATFSQLSLSLGTLTSGKNYDVFIYSNSGTLTLELSAAWTNDTTRADALALQDGVYVKSGTTTRRWLGTIRTTSTTTTEDSDAKRLVFNAYNPAFRRVYAVNGGTYTYASSTIRQANATSTNQVEILNGWPNNGDGQSIDLEYSQPIEISNTGGADEQATIGIGENSTTAFASGGSNATHRVIDPGGVAILVRTTVIARLVTPPRLGYSAFSMNEQVNTGTGQFLPGAMRGTYMT